MVVTSIAAALRTVTAMVVCACFTAWTYHLQQANRKLEQANDLLALSVAQLRARLSALQPQSPPNGSKSIRGCRNSLKNK